MTSIDLSSLRRQYMLAGLERSELHEDPMVQFQQWLDDAVRMAPDEYGEPNAMTLATADPEGRVSARVVLLKGCDAAGFRFFTNLGSPKARQLGANPRAALVFYWPYLERQVRIEGVVEQLGAEESARYFHARPRASQFSALVSPQSEVIEGREQLDRWINEAIERVGEAEVPAPDHWGGFLVRPDRIEFWKGRPDRRHDRFAYVAEPAGWCIQRLAP